MCNNDNKAWGVNKFGKIYKFKHSNWRKVWGWLKQITCGEGGVWGINPWGNLYRYEGWRWVKFNTEGNTFTWISSGLSGEVWAVDENDNVFKKNSHWIQVPGKKMRQVDVFDGIVWGVDRNNHIWFRSTTV